MRPFTIQLKKFIRYHQDRFHAVTCKQAFLCCTNITPRLFVAISDETKNAMLREQILFFGSVGRVVIKMRQWLVIHRERM
jgi:hypothetical protein